MLQSLAFYNMMRSCLIHFLAFDKPPKYELCRCCPFLSTFNNSSGEQQEQQQEEQRQQHSPPKRSVGGPGLGNGRTGYRLGIAFSCRRGP